MTAIVEVARVWVEEREDGPTKIEGDYHE